MKTKARALLLIVMSALAPALARAQSTVFTYQGQLKNSGSPAEGPHDVRFKLFNAVSGGVQVGSTQCVDNVSVKDGVFTASIDFGPQFTSTSDRWLEIEVRKDTGLSCGDTTGYTVLSPRQAVTPTPRAEAATTANSLTIPNGSSALVNLTNSGFMGVGTTSPTSQLHLNGVQDAFKITGNAPFMTLTDTGFSNTRVQLQNQHGNYFVVSESFLNGTNPGGFTMVDPQGRLSLGQFNPTGPFEVWVTGGVIGLQVANSGNIGIGTTAPTAKLDVRGDIRLGSSGQFRAAAGEENLRIIRGKVSSAGAILQGTGFSVTQPVNGLYTVTFSTPFASVPAFTVTPRIANNSEHVSAEISLNVDTSSSVMIGTFITSSGVYSSREFDFIAIGPR